MKNKSVIAVTVTYNRFKTMKKTIEHLLDQSYKLEKIIIVDNNSNDENKENLKKMEQEYKIIKVIWQNENLGGAGGFYHGMKYALEKYDPDWFWIMDDDAYPTKQCLEILINKGKNLNNIGYLAPAIFGIDNKKYQTYHHKIISEDKVNDITISENIENLEYITKIEANAFVGPLFSSEAIKKVGLPDKDLFIYGDDTEYTYRVSRKLNGYLIKEAIINHQDPPYQGKVIAPEGWWKEYYMFRNRFLFINQFSENEFERKKSINKLKRELYKRILGCIVKSHYKGFRKIRIELLKKAIKDGVNGNKGQTINPIKYIDNIKENKSRLGY